MNKDSLQKLKSNLIHNWDRSVIKDSSTIMGFLIGFNATHLTPLGAEKATDGTYKSVIQRFATHIYLKHKIHHVCLKAQIETYAYKNQMTWVKAFYDLFDQFVIDFPAFSHDEDYRPFDTLKPLNKKSIPKLEVASTKYHPLDSIIINGIKVEIGSILQTEDLIGKDRQRTVYYDIDIKEPIWDLLEFTEKDFKYLRLCYLTDSSENVLPEYREKALKAGRLRRICSGYSDKVISLIMRDDKCFAYTKYLEIELTQAFQAGEIKIIDQRRAIDSRIDEHLSKAICGGLANLAMGLLSEDEVMPRIYTWQFHKILIDWSRYDIGFSGWYYKIEE